MLSYWLLRDLIWIYTLPFTVNLIECFWHATKKEQIVCINFGLQRETYKKLYVTNTVWLILLLIKKGGKIEWQELRQAWRSSQATCLGYTLFSSHNSWDKLSLK